MPDTRKVGIQIDLQSNVAEQLSATSAAVESAGESLAAFGKDGTRSLGSVEDAMGMTGLQSGILSNVVTELAMTMQSVGLQVHSLLGDQAAANAAFREAATVTQMLSSGIAVGLNPVFSAFRKTVKDTGTSTDELEGSVKDLVAHKLADWGLKAGMGIADGLKKGAIVAINVVSELSSVIRDAVTTSSGAVLGLIKEMLVVVDEARVRLEGLGRLNPFRKLLGPTKEFQDALEGSKEKISATTAEFGKMEVRASAALARVAGLTATFGGDLEKNLAAAKVSLDEAAGGGAVEKVDRLADAFGAVGASAAEAARLGSEAFKSAAYEYTTHVLSMQAMAQQMQSAIAATAAAQISAILLEGKSLVDVMEDVSKQVVTILVQMATKAIVAYAAEAAAGAAASQAGVPFIGPALAVAAAGAMLAFVLALRGKVQGGGGGGVSSGGAAVPSAVGAATGPTILTRTGSVTPVSQGVQSQSAPMTVHATIQTLELPTETQRKRVIQQIASEMETMARDGQIFRDFAPQGA